MNPQQIQQALEARAGRALTPQELEQAKAALPGWESGQITEAQLQPLYAYLDQNAGNTGVTTRSADDPTNRFNTPQTTPEQPGIGQSDNPGGPGYQPTNNPTNYPGYGAPETPGIGGGQPGDVGTGPVGTTGPGFLAPGQTGGGTPGFSAPTFNAPTFNAPTFNAPGYTKPPAFHFDDFRAPSVDEAMNSPGYQFRKQQGESSLQNWAAARGTLNDSGTAKALMDYGQAAGSQEYQNVYNRDFNTWNANRGNAANEYSTNYGSQYLDPYSIAFQGANASFAPQMAGFQANVNSGMAGFGANVNSGMAGFGANVNSQMAGYNNQNAFDMAGFNANVGAGMAAFNANVNNQQLMYGTQAQAGQHQNDMNYLNAWNAFLNSQNYYSDWQDRTFNKTFQTANA